MYLGLAGKVNPFQFKFNPPAVAAMLWTTCREREKQT
jgi:hypothetical protein